MSSTVFCKKYNQEMEGLDTPPLPGEKGQYILQNISRKAWEEWQAKQTRLINENRLNLLDRDDRAYIQQQMDAYINNEETDEAEGYVPPG